VGFESGRRIFLTAALVTVVGSQRLVPGSKHGGRGTVRAGPLRVNAHGPTTYVSRRAHRIYGPKRRPYIRIFKTLLAAQILTFCRSTVNEPEINGPFLDQLQTHCTSSPIAAVRAAEHIATQFRLDIAIAFGIVQGVHCLLHLQLLMSPLELRNYMRIGTISHKKRARLKNLQSKRCLRKQCRDVGFKKKNLPFQRKPHCCLYNPLML
jgi:hypothetical protein